MNSVALNEPVGPTRETEWAESLSLDLLGFDRCRQYALLARPDETPFLWLQMKDDPSLAFLVVEPAVVAPEYHPNIADRDAAALGIRTPDDAMLLNIVTVRGPDRATVNLKGPIVINRQTATGKQVIPEDAAAYSVHHPLPVEH